jgi:sarcosine/dimethylglycine N-methyltransferase
MTNSKTDTEREAQIYRRTYDTALSHVISVMWGGHLHVGVFESAGDTLLDAQLRADHILATAASVKPGDHVLEVACGIGGTARYLASRFGAKVTATNIAEVQLEEAREITSREGFTSIDYRFADYHNLPFADASFDVWWCQEAMLYSIDKPRVVREAWRVLKPGGRLVFSDLTLDQPDRRAHDEYAAAIRAPGLWSRVQWRELIGTIGVEVLLECDWSAHVAMTFDRVRNTLLTMQDEFARSAGAEVVGATVGRMTRQLAAARAGQLGCIAFVLTRSV